MKRIIFLLCFTLILASCGSNDSNNTENKANQSEQSSESLKTQNKDSEQGSKTSNKQGEENIKVKETKKVIYTTFFPVYDLTKRIVGDKMEIRNIIKGNEGPHSFELSINDMVKIAQSDLIIYNGAGMESFIDDLKEVVQDEKNINAEDVFLDLSQGLTLLRTDNSDDMTNVNPHTWLSVKNAMEELDTIYQKISSIDPKNEPYYKDNLEKALKEFDDLEKKMQDELSKIKKKEKYFVASHAAFNYLANDYGLKQVAVTGISPDDEPSAKELRDIAEFVKKHNIKTIFFEGKSTPAVAETLARESGVKTDTLYTLENLTEEEIKMGYLKLMQHNLNALVKSFNE